MSKRLLKPITIHRFYEAYAADEEAYLTNFTGTHARYSFDTFNEAKKEGIELNFQIEIDNPLSDMRLPKTIAEFVAIAVKSSFTAIISDTEVKVAACELAEAIDV